MHDHLRKYQSLPPERYLSPKIVELDAEARALSAELRAAHAERATLADPAHDDAAQRADREAAAEAIRAGKSPHSTGHPVAEKLAADRQALDFEIDALAEAIHACEAEMETEFGILASNPKTSGYTAAVVERDRYRKAVAALAAARANFHQAVAVAAYIRAAADAVVFEGEPIASDGYPVRNPAWLRAAALRTDAHRHVWLPDRAAPPVSFYRYVNHLGIRNVDAQLTGSQALDVFADEIKEDDAS